MLSLDQARTELSDLLRKKSIFHGEFTLASGARSSYYFDCRLTTLDPKGAWLIGQLMHALIRKEATARNLTLNAVGGLTMEIGRSEERRVGKECRSRWSP